MKDNKLIAEFMGFTKDSEDLYLIDNYNLRSEDEYQATYISEMKFHTSWDWLIPVIQKVNEVSGYNDYNTNRLHMQRVLDDCINENALGIDSVHKAVVEFIQEYRLTPKEVN
jgi:hypothetical protein